MSKHTPGPWGLDGVHEVVDATSAGVVQLWHWNKSNNERDANARLIAAAPEMYEALRELLAEWDAENDRTMEEDSAFQPDSAAIEAIRAVLAKIDAEG